LDLSSRGLGHLLHQDGFSALAKQYQGQRTHLCFLLFLPVLALAMEQQHLTFQTSRDIR
jgi:hypothetical protein